jgi:hypothetical protein
MGQGIRDTDRCQRCHAVALVDWLYIEFTFCVNCGQIQGNYFPKKMHGSIVARETHGYQEGRLPGKE